MAIEVITGTTAELDEIAAVDAAEYEYPMRGEHIGLGPHATIGDSGVGWTMRRASIFTAFDGASEVTAILVDEELTKLAKKDAKTAKKLAKKIVI
jgi:hypothetical protein